MRLWRRKNLWRILVPRYSNGGTEYPLAYYHAWDVSVRNIAGGITINRTAKGQWISPTRELYVDEMIPVEMYCSRHDIRRIMAHTLKYYDQEAVMAYKVSSEVIIRHRKRAR